MVTFVKAFKTWVGLMKNRGNLITRLLESRRFFRVLEGKDPLVPDYDHGQPWLWRPYLDPDCLEMCKECTVMCDSCYWDDLHLQKKYKFWLDED